MWKPWSSSFIPSVDYSFVYQFTSLVWCDVSLGLHHRNVVPFSSHIRSFLHSHWVRLHAFTLTCRGPKTLNLLNLIFPDLMANTLDMIMLGWQAYLFFFSFISNVQVPIHKILIFFSLLQILHFGKIWSYSNIILIWLLQQSDFLILFYMIYMVFI